MREVKVVPYHKEWATIFQMESEKIAMIFGNGLITIHHIGSTAIPNIQAKPIIDVLAEVKNIETVDCLNLRMKQIGYEAKGEFGIKNRRFFIKGGDQRTHHVHVFEKGDKEIARHLAFRDYMLAHPKEAQQYSELKQLLAKQHPFDIQKYIEGKHDYIQTIDEKAKKWRALL